MKGNIGQWIIRPAIQGKKITEKFSAILEYPFKTSPITGKFSVIGLSLYI